MHGMGGNGQLKFIFMKQRDSVVVEVVLYFCKLKIQYQAYKCSIFKVSSVSRTFYKFLYDFLSRISGIHVFCIEMINGNHVS